MRRSIKMRTKGRTIPLRTCEKYIIGMRGKFGKRMIPAPKKMIKE
jgi:hypothetical protein